MLEELYSREEVALAPYAFRSRDSRGRRWSEPPHPYRLPFQRDRDRIVHSAAFRRLSEKMQVFSHDVGKDHRVRLTHTMEVAMIARTIGRSLALNGDLIETLALLHDVGHPAFGHEGERQLDRLLADEGGFDHNAQALRIVEKLERRYADFPGMNLSWEVLDGQRYKSDKKRNRAAGKETPLPLLEAQVVDLADSISYDAHDLDDALRLGYLDEITLEATSLWCRVTATVRERWTNLSRDDFRTAAVHEVIDLVVGDVIRTSHARLTSLAPASPEAARQLSEQTPLITTNDTLTTEVKEWERFLSDNVYRHPRVLASRKIVAEQLETVFNWHLAHTAALPPRYADVIRDESPRRAVADFIADMTDAVAQRDYETRIVRVS